MKITQIFLLTILIVVSVGLLISALIKNYHCVRYYAIKDKEAISTVVLIFRIIGSRATAIVWIFPFRINEAYVNAEAQKHKEKFNQVSKYFRFFWSLLVVYVLVFLLILGKL